MYHLGQEGRQNDALELLLFQYFILQDFGDRRKMNDFLGFRRVLQLDRENPNVMSLERQLLVSDQRVDKRLVK